MNELTLYRARARGAAACNMNCFECRFDDCVNGSTYSEKSLYKNRSEHARENARARSKRARDKARESGLCTTCKKKPRKYGVMCYECYLRQKRYDRARSTGERQLWKETGLCYYCGDQVVPGKRVCQKHYDILLKSIAICNAANQSCGPNRWGQPRKKGEPYTNDSDDSTTSKNASAP